jgi:uncharacterized membrane protein YgcG
MKKAITITFILAFATLFFAVPIAFVQGVNKAATEQTARTPLATPQEGKQLTKDIYPTALPGRRVHDFYGILPQDVESELEALLFRFEDSTGIQIAVVTTDNTREQDQTAYAIELFNKWGIGEKGVDNGLLIFRSFDDRGYAIITGRATEKYLTDYDASRIVETVMGPLMDVDDNVGTMVETTKAIIKHLGWNSFAEREQEAQREKARNRQNATSFFIVFLCLAVLGLTVWPIVLLVKLQKRANAIKKKLAENEKRIIHPSNVVKSSSDWASWAKAELKTIEQNFDTRHDEYEKGKKNVQALLKDRKLFSVKDVEKAEEGLSLLDTDLQYLLGYLETAKAIPLRIAEYVRAAPAELKKAKDAVEKTKKLIEQKKHYGFFLAAQAQGINLCLDLVDINEKKLKGENESAGKIKDPDRFKAVYEACDPILQKAAEIDQAVTILVGIQQHIDKNAGFNLGKIAALKNSYDLHNKTLTGMTDTYPNGVWDHLALSMEKTKSLLSEAETKIKTAKEKNDMKVQDFAEANRLHNEGITIITAASELYDKIVQTKQAQEEAKKDYARLLSAAKIAIASAETACGSSSDVEQTAKNLLSNAKSKKDDAQKRAKEAKVDWVGVSNLLKGAETNAKEAKNKAESDINSAIARRKKAVEDAAEKVRKDAAEKARKAEAQRRTSSSSHGSYGGGRSGGGGVGGRR